MNGNQDFRDLLQCLNDAGAKFLVVGAYAVIYHTEPRQEEEREKKIMSEPTKQNNPPRERVIMSRVIRKDQHDDRSFDIEFWQKVGDVGRFAAAWQMVREVQLIRGQSGELPRLDKSVGRIIRRSQAASKMKPQ